MKKKVTQWKKDYNFDSLYDMQGDIIESFDKRFNPDAAEPKTDKNGGFQGVYRVTIEYIEASDAK